MDEELGEARFPPLINFNKLIIKINVRRADNKGWKDKNVNKINLVLSGLSVEHSVYKPVV